MSPTPLSDAKSSDCTSVLFRRVEGRIEPVVFHIRNTYGFDEFDWQAHGPGVFWQEGQLIEREVPRGYHLEGHALALE